MDIPRSYIVAAQIGRYFGLAFAIFFGLLTIAVLVSRANVLDEDTLLRVLNLDNSMRTVGLLLVMCLGGFVVFGAISAVLKWINPH
jgi:hypothetical protein